MVRPTGVAVSIACAAILACGGSEEEVAPPRPETEARALPNVLWVTIDTLRPDHLSPYGYVRDTSPFLDRVARGGVRFDSVIAQGPWTFSSVPSLMTSRYPQVHRAMMVDGHPEAVIADGSRTVASELSALGYRTVFVTGHGAIGAIYEICEGFDTCTIEYQPAEWVTERALSAARAADGRPLFLWAYYIDPHVPYVAPEELTDAFASDGLVRTGVSGLGPSDRDFVGYGTIPRRAWVEGRTDLDWYVAAYDAEIRYTDEHVERLMDGLEERRDDWLSMVFADHGESLTEHGLHLSHSVHLFDTILRIPWIVRWPGRIPEGHAVGTDVMALDFAPTLLGLIDSPAPQSWQGRDLSRCMVGSVPCESRPSFALHASGLVVMRAWPEKIHCNVFSPECQLYDLRADPGELRDICPERRARCAALRREVLAWHRHQPTPALDAERAGQLPEETRAALRELGYAR